MAEFVEGKRPVLEALKANIPAKCLYVADGLKGDKVVSDVVKRCHKMGVSVKQVKRSDLDARSERGSHQGLMLETRPYQYASAQDVIMQMSIMDKLLSLFWIILPMRVI